MYKQQHRIALDCHTRLVQSIIIVLWKSIKTILCRAEHSTVQRPGSNKEEILDRLLKIMATSNWLLPKLANELWQKLKWIWRDCRCFSLCPPVVSTRFTSSVASHFRISYDINAKRDILTATGSVSAECTFSYYLFNLKRLLAVFRRRAGVLNALHKIY